jgi:predicted dehydrogenase
VTTPTSLPAPRTPAPDAAPPLRWGILGTGGIAHTFAGTLRKNTRQVVHACASRSQEKADAFAREFGASRAYGSYEALAADPDVQAIYVATPHSHHAEHALLTIAAGKPTLVEKSFTRTAAEARLVVEAATASGVPLMEAMWTRFLPSMDVVRQLLEGGVLGDVETVLADHGQYFAVNPAHRLYAPELAGGALLDLGIYPLSFTFFALGTPGRVTAHGTAAETGVDRQVSAILDAYAAHPNAHAVVTTTLAAKTPTTASIAGSEARVELPGPFYVPQPVTLVARDGTRLTSDAPTIVTHEGLCHEAAHFATFVSEGRRESPLLPLAETVSIMETMDAIRAQLRPDGVSA